MKSLEEDSYQFSGFPVKASSVVDWLHQMLDVSYCILGAHGTIADSAREKRQSTLIFNKT